MLLADEIRAIPISPNIATDEVGKLFFAKLDEGSYTRDENPVSHFGVYFLCYNPKTKKVFLVHHKKSGLWLSAGGHVDKGESAFETLKREMHEELGIVYDVPVEPKPFLLTITRMDAPNYPCKTHYDIWYAIPTDGSDFKIDPSEFHETRWLSIAEARSMITDQPNLEAIAKIEERFNQAP